MDIKTYTAKPKTVQAVEYKKKPLKGITESYQHIDNPNIAFGTDVVNLPNVGVKRVYEGNMIVVDDEGKPKEIIKGSLFDENYDEVKPKAPAPPADNS